MRALSIVLAVAVAAIGGCSQRDASNGQKKESTTSSAGPAVQQSNSKDRYIPPTADELAPMRPEYSAELAKVIEPPEMAGKPMQVRRPAASAVLKIMDALDALGSPEKASHGQRAAAMNDLLQLAKEKELEDGIGRTTLYGALAALACIDGADAGVVIGYANNAISDEGGDALALRARMFLKDGIPINALDDLEKLMVNRDGRALAGGSAEPREASAPCGWSIADFDAFGDEPRALAAKGFYLSSFLAFSARGKRTVKEKEARELYRRSSMSWHSPIPHYLTTSLYGLGSEHSMTGAGCIRGGSGRIAEIESACVKHDDGMRQQIRDLTMALVIDPKFAPALSARANAYLMLAQASYADGKPSRRLFELAIKDFSAALAADSKDKHALYCDRALALASIGRYEAAALGYEQGMKFAKGGVEDSPFVYTQLARVYSKLGRFEDAAAIISQAIMNASGAGMDVVVFMGGMKGFRNLYPEYDLLPDEILAEAVRRRYYPNFPKKWNEQFISGNESTGGKILSSTLAELYIIRGDAYINAGRREQGLADYRRVKSDAWAGKEPFTPLHMYFDERGRRKLNVPEPFPPPPPKG